MSAPRQPGTPRNMTRAEAAFWYREGYGAGVAAERRRLFTEETARRQRAVHQDLQQLIALLAGVVLESDHAAASASARERERVKRGAR